MMAVGPAHTQVWLPVYSGHRTIADGAPSITARHDRASHRPPTDHASVTPPDAQFSSALLELLPRLRRYARMLTHDSASADDLVQDTVERAWSHHQQWQPGSDLRAWLFSILHNRRIDLLRSSQRLQSLDDESAPLSLDEITSPPSPADDRLGAIDLQRAFERLSDEHREVLVLVAIEQLSYDETARTLGVPIGTVMSRLSRARQRLRFELGDDAPATARLTRIK